MAYGEYAAKREAALNPQQVQAIVFATVTVALGVAVMLLAMNAGRADHAPQITADGVVIYGDWGLYRPGHIAPYAVGPYGPYVLTNSRYGFGQYFPSNRNDPGAYRRRPPVDRQIIPSEPYFRTWGAQSQPLNPHSATVYTPFEPPAVIYAPRFDDHKPHSLKN
jgi:hypothetical protein